MIEPQKVEHLFSGWHNTMIASYLQGCMGYATADDPLTLASAQIVVGDFCFFAGKPDVAFARQAAASLIIPQNQEWGEAIEAAWSGRVQTIQRYAMKKAPQAFDTERLGAYAAALPNGFSLRPFDEGIYRQTLGQSWSKDFCAQFAGYDDYHKRGLGVAVLHRSEVVSGASSYIVYNGGIEIEIDTQPQHRQRGLATACGAALILECLRRGLYPNWDAHDLRSVALAEKLGYQIDYPYTTYVKE